MRASKALGLGRVATRPSTTSNLAGHWQRKLPQSTNIRPSHGSLRTFHASFCRYEESHGASSTNPSAAVPKPKPSKGPSDFAFAFDIDGVLYQGKQPVKGAANSLRWLCENDVRYVFLTNGGGRFEEQKAKTLRSTLGMEDDKKTVHGKRMIQSHTPFQGWASGIKQSDTILITGQHPNWVRGIAKKYGFTNVVTPADLEKHSPSIYPFISPQYTGGQGTGKDRWNNTNPLPNGKEIFAPEDPLTKRIPQESLKIDHIFVWNDPRDWSFDIQVIYDVLISHRGYIGTVSSQNGDKSLPNNGWQQDGQPSLWISNLDLFWKTEYPINRFGTGAFVAALKAVWAAATNGAELQYTALGKPLQTTYQYAHDRLLHMDRRGGPSKKSAPLKRVYMIGDNPESDIRGANEFNSEDGTEWKSILVKTGVWKSTAVEPEPKHKPDVIVDDVLDAVVWALNEEGIDVTRESVLEYMSSGEQVSGETADKAVTMPSAPIGRIVA